MTTGALVTPTPGLNYFLSSTAIIYPPNLISLPVWSCIPWCMLLLAHGYSQIRSWKFILTYWNIEIKFKSYFVKIHIAYIMELRYHRNVTWKISTKYLLRFYKNNYIKHRVKCSLSLLATAGYVIHFTNIRTVVLCVVIVIRITNWSWFLFLQLTLCW